MNFTLNEDQSALQSLANQIFQGQVTDEFLLEHDRSGQSFNSELWSLLAEQGILGLAIPESCGGSDLGFFELTLLLQEQGRSVAPVPLLSNLVMAGLPVAAFGSDDQKRQYLTPLASGQHQLSAAVAELGMADAVQTQVLASTQGEGWVLSGEKHAVPYGQEASAILVPVIDEDNRCSVFIVDTDAPGVDLQAQRTMLGDSQSRLLLNNVSVDRSKLLGEIGDGEHILSWIELRANTALCAIQLGVTEEALRRTAEYTCERTQFGRAIGSFQAVGMRAADAFIDIEAIRSTLWQAAWRLSEGLQADAEVRAAKYWACIGGHRVVHTSQHLHGGIGSDLEYPIHRFYLWAKNTEMSFGATALQLGKLGQLLALDDSIGASWLAVS
jgi:alkylation response protein AidB-like acyl-CoA dehydrogenase